MGLGAIQRSDFTVRCEQNNLTCAICTEPYKTPSTINVCLHTYCLECLAPAIKNCPECRTPFTAANIKHDFDKQNRIDKIRMECLNMPAARGSESSLLEDDSPVELEASTSESLEVSALCTDDVPVLHVGDLVYDAIQEERFDDALVFLAQDALDNPSRKGWDRDILPNSPYHRPSMCLVTASGKPNAPRELIEKLAVLNNMYMPENHEHFHFYDRAMTPVKVAAREGNITALQVFISKGWYAITDWRRASAYAIDRSQAAALDLIWSQKIKFPIGNGNYSEEFVHERCSYNSVLQSRPELRDVVIKFCPKAR